MATPQIAGACAPFNIENSLGPNLRVVAVLGDNMVPTLKGGGVDHLIVRPTHQYEGEGIYAVQSAYGKVEIFRAQNVGGGNIALLSDNATYRRRDVSVEEFNEMVLGIALHQLHRLRVDTPIVFARCA